MSEYTVRYQGKTYTLRGTREPTVEDMRRLTGTEVPATAAPPAAAPTSLQPSRPLSLQELFPTATQALQPTLANLTSPGGPPVRAAVGAVGMDLPRLLNRMAAYGMERLQGNQRPFAAELRGANIPLENGQPSRQATAMREVPGELLKAAGFGAAAVTGGELLRRVGGRRPALTTEQLLAMPEGRVGKLPPAIKDLYIRERRGQLAQQLQAERAGIATAGQSAKTELSRLNRETLTHLKDETVRLEQQLQDRAYQVALKLKQTD